MKIYIMSSGRAAKQITWNGLPQEIQESAKIVVPWDEREAYKNFPVLTDKSIIRDVTKTRQFLVETTTGPMCMLDDDLTFAVRRTDNPTKFSPATPEDIIDLFADIESSLRKFPHVGVASREGGNRNIEPYLYNTRAMRVLACDCDVLNSLSIRYDRLKLMSDFDVTLQLLRAGCDTAVINWVVNNQAGSNAAGGCSQYRTKTMQEADAHLLQSFHPEFVRLSIKTTKQAGMWAERLDVTCAWKKARASHGA